MNEQTREKEMNEQTRENILSQCAFEHQGICLEGEQKKLDRPDRERIISYLESMVWVFNPEKERSEFLCIIQELKSGLWKDGQALKEGK